MASDEYKKYTDKPYFQKGMVKYTSRDYESIMEDFWEMVPKLTELWQPAPDKSMKDNVDMFLQNIHHRNIPENIEESTQSVYIHLFPDFTRAYVGRTGTLLKDRSGSDGNAYKSHNPDFYEDCCDVGWNNLYHIIVYSNLDFESAVKLEKCVIALMKESGYQLYNKNHGSGGPVHHSETTKQKIGRASRGHTLSEEARKKISDKNSGKVRSEEVREASRIRMHSYWTEEQRLKHSQLCTDGNRLRQCGKHLSEETKLKISKKSKGREMSADWRAKISKGLQGHVPVNAKKVKQIFPDGSFLIYASCAECDRKLGKYLGYTSACCRTGKIDGGVRFEYLQ